MYVCWSDLEAGADKGALGLQEVDTSENQELNITVTEPEDQPPMQASGDQTKPIASALAEAFSSTLSPLLNVLYAGIPYILGFAPFSSKSLTTSIVLLMNSFCFCISS
jgi:hypothetical protein